MLRFRLLASSLVSERKSWSGGHEFGSTAEQNLVIWIQVFHSGYPDVIMSSLTCSALSTWLQNAHSLASDWQTHLPDENNTEDDSSLNLAHYQYTDSRVWGKLCREATEAPTVNQLTSTVISAPSSWSRIELGALTDGRRPRRLKSFPNTYSKMGVREKNTI